jgi:hypothetical protein
MRGSGSKRNKYFEVKNFVCWFQQATRKEKFESTFP